MSSLFVYADNLPWLAALAAGAILATRLARALPHGSLSPKPRRLLSGQEGASVMLDFILVFPIFTMIILMVVQLALLINARLVVNYAAYTAARSAIVWLPEGEDLAHEHMQAASQISCTPISSVSIPGLKEIGLLQSASVAPLLVHGGLSSRRLMRAGSKFLYSQLATRAHIAPPVGESGSYGAQEPITATVTHLFYLNVPYAGGLFASMIGGYNLGFPVVEIRDSHTLLNEGRVETAR